MRSRIGYGAPANISYGALSLAATTAQTKSWTMPQVIRPISSDGAELGCLASRPGARPVWMLVGMPGHEASRSTSDGSAP